MPLNYMKNRHLHPQNKIFSRLRRKRILKKMESPSDLSFLPEIVHLDMDIKVNSTEKVGRNIRWDKGLANLVKRINEKDFKLYAYPFMETFD